MKTEADLTKSQIKKVHDKADELPKNEFLEIDMVKKKVTL